MYLLRKVAKIQNTLSPFEVFSEKIVFIHGWSYKRVQVLCCQKSHHNTAQKSQPSLCFSRAHRMWRCITLAVDLSQSLLFRCRASKCQVSEIARATRATHVRKMHGTQRPHEVVFCTRPVLSSSCFGSCLPLTAKSVMINKFAETHLPLRRKETPIQHVFDNWKKLCPGRSPVTWPS